MARLAGSAPWRRRTCTAGAAVSLAAAALSGCDVPRDSHGTSRRVQGAELRAGVMDARPFAAWDGPEPSGPEPDLVRRLAAELGARVTWVRGSETTLLAALEHHEVDLVVGGLLRDTPYAPRVGLTAAYARYELAVAAPPGSHLDDGPVAVEPHRHVTALVRRSGRVVAETARPGSSGGPAAGYDFELAAWGKSGPREVLAREEHAFAVPPGEHAWVSRVEGFLRREAPSLRARLEEDAKRIALDAAEAHRDPR